MINEGEGDERGRYKRPPQDMALVVQMRLLKIRLGDRGRKKEKGRSEMKDEKKKSEQGAGGWKPPGILRSTLETPSNF